MQSFQELQIFGFIAVMEGGITWQTKANSWHYIEEWSHFIFTVHCCNCNNVNPGKNEAHERIEKLLLSLASPSKGLLLA